MGESELTVNHIDGNKSNNAIENLEYMTLSEQNWHRSRDIKVGNQVPIYCKETGDIYPNAKVAGEILGIKIAAISLVKQIINMDIKVFVVIIL